MSPPGLERAPVDSRDAVLDAALKEFGRHGYAAASLETILRARPMSERVFRAHFDDKAGLAVAVIERESARQLGRLGEVRAATTKDEFWAAFRARTVASPQHGDTAALELARLTLSAHRHHEVVARLEAHTKRWREKLAKLLRRGQELRAVRTDVPVGVLVTMAQGLKRASVAAHLPVERTASDGELVAFSRNYFFVLQRSLEARE
jgi:TetR/AcrR family transcriptional regulator, copper-responsive repressor